MDKIKEFSSYKQGFKNKTYTAQVTDAYNNTYTIKVRLIDEVTIGKYIDFLGQLEKGEPLEL